MIDRDDDTVELLINMIQMNYFHEVVAIQGYQFMELMALYLDVKKLDKGGNLDDFKYEQKRRKKRKNSATQ